MAGHRALARWEDINISHDVFCLTIVIQQDGDGAMQAVLDKLVSQADREGIPLAEVIAKELSVNEIDRIGEFLRKEMSENYSAIEGFMRDIEVPGTYDFSSMADEQLDVIQEGILSALSDTPLSVSSEA